jgi:hypothetical protein
MEFFAKEAESSNKRLSTETGSDYRLPRISASQKLKENQLFSSKKN